MGANKFDGAAGLVTARIMAVMNRDAELEAVGILAPHPGDRILAIGIGPGVGIGHLISSAEGLTVVGVDPSVVMLTAARQRNRPAIESGAVTLVQTTADALMWGDASFDGAVAVNSLQLWEPLEASLAEVARVLRPGARLVTLTHDWAVERSTGRTPDSWADYIGELGERFGLTELATWRARAEHGRSVVVTLTKRELQEPAVLSTEIS